MLTANRTSDRAPLRLANPAATFIVTAGPNAGATYDLQENGHFHCGTDIENDVILNATDVEAEWKIRLRQEDGTVYLLLLDGELSNGLSKRPLSQNEEVVVERDNEFVTNSLSFEIRYAATPAQPGTDRPSNGTTLNHSGQDTTGRGNSAQGTTTAAKQAGHSHAVKNALYIFSILCIVLGVLSGMYAVTGSVILANADTAPGQNRFLEKVGDSKLAYLDVKQIGNSNKYEIKGTINSREEQRLLNQIAKETGADVTMQLQINNEVLESVEDIFRVNGVQAQAKIADTGGVNVYTQTSETARLDSVRQIVKRDIPSITDLEIFNTPPVVVDLPRKRTFKPTPEKRITLISAGENAYIMTEDKSRYFVGALLPSGHLVEEIQEGVVIVSMDGKLETLKY